MTEADIGRFAERDMRVEIVPRVKGFAWDANRYRAAISATSPRCPNTLALP